MLTPRIGAGSINPPMSDEFKLQRDASQGSRAKTLLENELLTGAFKALKDQYSANLLGTTVDQTDARERLYLAYRVVGEVERHLTSIMSNGSVAAAELKQLTEVAERKKRFGIV